MQTSLDKELSGRVALVTVAASGIGAAVVRLLARRDARVVVADSDAKGAKAVAEQIGAQVDTALAHAVDVTGSYHLADGGYTAA